MILPGWFQRILLDLIRMADSASYDWMLLGAVPVSYYGWPRATTDLDFSISADISASEFVDNWMEDLGFEKEFGPEEIPGKGIWLSKFWDDKKKKTIGVDVFFSVGEWQAEAIKRRVSAKIVGNDVWIPSLEDLILFKLIGGREKDILDLEGIFDRSLSKVDWSYLNQWIRKLGLKDDFGQVMESFSGGGS